MLLWNKVCFKTERVGYRGFCGFATSTLERLGVTVLEHGTGWQQQNSFPYGARTGSFSHWSPVQADPTDSDCQQLLTQLHLAQ